MPRIKPPRQETLAIRAEPVPQEDIVIDLDTPIEEPKDIELAPQAPTATTPVEPSRSAAQAPAESPKDDDAVKRALEATNRADELQRQYAALQAQTQLREQELARERDSAQYQQVLSGIGAEQAALDKAESDYAAYAQAGDWANAAKAQRVIGVASARLDRLEADKSNFELLNREQPRAATQPPIAPTVDQQIEKFDIPANAKAYLRSHPELVSDRGKLDRLGNVHNYIKHSVTPWSDEYFATLDKEFGYAAPAVERAQSAAQPRRSMPVSAPVSREAHSPTGQRRTNTITLTPEEREIARNSFGSVQGAPDLTPDQKERLYAENKAKLHRMRQSGEYRQTTEQTG